MTELSLDTILSMENSLLITSKINLDRPCLTSRNICLEKLNTILKSLEDTKKIDLRIWNFCKIFHKHWTDWLLLTNRPSPRGVFRVVRTWWQLFVLSCYEQIRHILLCILLNGITIFLGQTFFAFGPDVSARAAQGIRLLFQWPLAFWPVLIPWQGPCHNIHDIIYIKYIISSKIIY